MIKLLFLSFNNCLICLYYNFLQWITSPTNPSPSLFTLKEILKKMVPPKNKVKKRNKQQFSYMMRPPFFLANLIWLTLQRNFLFLTQSKRGIKKASRMARFKTLFWKNLTEMKFNKRQKKFPNQKAYKNSPIKMVLKKKKKGQKVRGKKRLMKNRRTKRKMKMEKN